MKALNRWFGSDLAREMARMSRLDAEVPFIISLPGEDASDVFLEGEIDLLGLDEDGSHARIVDYKTGGWSGETQRDLQMKHVLQAACYAYAVLLQGVQSVEADFVRVERGCADAPQQPQCVRYRFEQEEVPQLAQAIAEAYAQAQGRSI